MAVIPQHFKDSVVAIGNDKKEWMATGFVVARKNEAGGYNTFLVTNKHVFEKNGCPLFKKIILRFNLANKITAKDFEVLLFDDSGKKLYSVHPNPNVDVASLCIDAEILSKDLGGLSAFTLDSSISMTQKEMIDNELVEGTLVYMLGFPSRLVGVNSKVPLCRLGCISKVSEIMEDNSFLVDIQNFPGSSGSPIINRIETVHLSGSKCYNKTSLIGIVSAYIPYNDSLISLQTGKIMQRTEENSGIALVYNVDSIKTVVECEFLRASDPIDLLPNPKSPKIDE